MQIPVQFQLMADPVELLHPIFGIPLASIGKLPFIGKLPIEA